MVRAAMGELLASLVGGGRKTWAGHIKQNKIERRGLGSIGTTVDKDVNVVELELEFQLCVTL